MGLKRKAKREIALLIGFDNQFRNTLRFFEFATMKLVLIGSLLLVAALGHGHGHGDDDHSGHDHTSRSHAHHDHGHPTDHEEAAVADAGHGHSHGGKPCNGDHGSSAPAVESAHDHGHSTPAEDHHAHGHGGGHDHGHGHGAKADERKLSEEEWSEVWARGFGYTAIITLGGNAFILLFMSAPLTGDFLKVCVFVRMLVCLVLWGGGGICGGGGVCVRGVRPRVP